MILKLSLIFIGGGTGSVLRYLISIGFGKMASLNFPWATFCANVLSCLIMVLVVKWDKAGGLSEPYRLLLMIGFLGGLSTFSTFSYETALLMKEGHLTMAFSNVGLSVLVCVYCLYRLT